VTNVHQLGSITNQLKLAAAGGKKYLTKHNNLSPIHHYTAVRTSG